MECTLFGAVDGRVVMAIVSAATADRCLYLKMARGWTWGDFMKEVCRRSAPGAAVLSDADINAVVAQLEEETPNIVILE